MPTPQAPQIVSPAALTVRLVVEAGANLTAAAEHLRKAMNPTGEGRAFTREVALEEFVDVEILRAYEFAAAAAYALRQLVRDQAFTDPETIQAAVAGR